MVAVVCLLFARPAEFHVVVVERQYFVCLPLFHDPGKSRHQSLFVIASGGIHCVHRGDLSSEQTKQALMSIEYRTVTHRKTVRQAEEGEADIASAATGRVGRNTIRP